MCDRHSRAVLLVVAGRSFQAQTYMPAVVAATEATAYTAMVMHMHSDSMPAHQTSVQALPVVWRCLQKPGAAGLPGMAAYCQLPRASMPHA